MQTLSYKDQNINIYDFEEAEDIIKDYASRAEWAVKSYGGKNRNKTEFCLFPFSFDIETTTIKPGELNYKPKSKDAPPIGFPYLFQFNIGGRAVLVRQYSEAMKIFDWLAEYFRTGDKRHIVIFIHNLNFEYTFFKNLWKIKDKGSFALDPQHPVTIYLENGIIFKDSYKLTGLSLETLTKDWSTTWKKEREIMNYSVLRTPYSELEENVLIYSALDVLSLSDAIINYLHARGEEVFTRCTTKTSFARRDLKNIIGLHANRRTKEQRAYFRIIKLLRMNPEQWKLIRELARGGNTHANRFFTGKILHGLGHWDIVSSYPAQMVCYPEFPIGRFVEIENAELEEIEDMEAGGYCTIFRTVLINPELKEGVSVPYIPLSLCNSLDGNAEYNDNGRYIRGSKALQISIFGHELPIIKKQYNFDDFIVLKCYAAPKSYLPEIVRRFILDLYEKKTVLKNIEGMEEEYKVAKELLNSIYGMFYTSPVRIKYQFINGEIVETAEEDIEEELKKQQNGESYFAPYIWGAVVAMLGRCYLQRMIDACGPDSFVYGDTDSVFALNYETVKPKIEALKKRTKRYQRRCGFNLKYKDQKGKFHELGDIDEEPFVQTFRTYGAKKYITVTEDGFEATIAGVPKSTYIQENGKLKKISVAEAVIKTPENFKLDLNFPGTITGKNSIWYNNEEDLNGLKLKDAAGRDIEIHSNAALLPCDYLLGISDNYKLCLHIEGNFNLDFMEVD